MSDNNDHVGAFPIKQDITVLPADDPKKVKLGWTVHEIPGDMGEVEYWKKHLSPEEFDKWFYESDYRRNQETNLADEYIGYGKDFKRDNIGYTTIQILQFLWGQPWNNLALNFIHAVRPSRIRVIKHNECMHLDAMRWRVTVMLDEKSLIKEINQEVIVGVRGTRLASIDLWKQLEAQKNGTIDNYEQQDKVGIIINDYCLTELSFDEQ